MLRVSIKKNGMNVWGTRNIDLAVANRIAV